VNVKVKKGGPEIARHVAGAEFESLSFQYLPFSNLYFLEHQQARSHNLSLPKIKAKSASNSAPLPLLPTDMNGGKKGQKKWGVRKIRFLISVKTR